MDKDTEKILADQKTLHFIVNHDGWKIGHKMFVDKILELQNAFSIEDSDPQKMLIDLQARKIATTVLYDFLRVFEGTATQAEEKHIDTKSYIIKED